MLAEMGRKNTLRRLGVKTGERVARVDRQCVGCGRFFRIIESSSRILCGKNCPGKVPWNKGLTKESDDRIKQTGRKISQKIKGRFEGMKYEQFLSSEGLEKQRKRLEKQKCPNCGKFMRKKDNRYLCSCLERRD